MTTEHESWILLKPDTYVAIPVSAFVAACDHIKNIREEWAAGRGDRLELSDSSMSMKLLSHEQMTALLVRNRVTQASEPAQ